MTFEKTALLEKSTFQQMFKNWGSGGLEMEAWNNILQTINQHFPETTHLGSLPEGNA
jgi:hypothetical protein